MPSPRSARMRAAGGRAWRQAAAGRGARRCGLPRQELDPPARTLSTCCAALARAACGCVLPSSTDTIMLPRIVETCGYEASCGRACFTLPRLVTKVSTPGSAVSICVRKPGELSTDARMGRSPVCNEKYVDCAVAVIQSRNFSAAETLTAPLLKMTQLSGPEIV